MGNQCCTDNNIPRGQLQKIQADMLMPISTNEYYLHQIPLDQNAQQKLNQLKDNQSFKQLFLRQKVMKHKFLDKYYIGAWDNGFPMGKGIMLQPEKYLYYGQFNKIPDGYGVVELFQQQIRYQGQIREGKAQGNGKITSGDGRYTFEGMMVNSFPNTGKIYIKNPHDQSKSQTITLEDFPNRKTSILYGDGRKYYGYISKKSFTPEGEGVALFPDNSKYEGNWAEGQMHGFGEFSWNDGTSYRGQYQHGRKHGDGIFTFASKKYYQGEWVNGKQNGKGTLFDQQGSIIHKGIWENGVFVRETD